ncbi:MAG TPA: PstC family ABC transporter permease [Candidatus Aminicenantes bacterium]|nr:PstC family ABC transporter permease [Candidatus Aminicenantes bacterium]
MSDAASRLRRLAAFLSKSLLLMATAMSLVAVLLIIVYIARDAIPFFKLHGLKELFASAAWFPSGTPPEFGAWAIFVGSALVTAGAVVVAVPLGVAAAIALSDILPYRLRQAVKPVIEVLAALPSVAYGFFALVIFAPLLQQRGGSLLAVAAWLVLLPLGLLLILIVSGAATRSVRPDVAPAARWILAAALAAILLRGLLALGSLLASLTVASGTNALNVSVVLGVMALPTIVSVAEDSLQAAGRELREGSYALGATRAETLFKAVMPAAGSGIIAAVILGVMRAIGETMVVWMASGNAAQVPQPWYNLLSPVRTLTATIAGDMGEADQVLGSSRYHVLFALALCLLVISLLANLGSEWILRRKQRRLGGAK